MPKTPSTLPVESPPIAAEQTASLGTVTSQEPERWAEVYFPEGDRGLLRIHPDAWKHAAAAQLHGWAAYKERTGKAVKLTAADYEKAIEAAASPELKPHAAADYRSRN